MSIVISQTQEVHEEINDLLGQLRSVSLDQRTKEAILKTWQARQHGNRGAAGGNVGGMGGMGGGMWGGGNRRTGPRKGPSLPQGAPEKADLLEGVEETNRGLQGKQSEKLERRPISKAAAWEAWAASVAACGEAKGPVALGG